MIVTGDDLLSCEEVGALLGFSPDTVKWYAAHHPDRLPPRVGWTARRLWKRSDVLAWKARRDAEGRKKGEAIVPIESRTPNALLRIAQVAHETGLSRSTIYERIRSGTFPASIRLGPKSVGWRVSDIDAFLANPGAYKAPIAA